jgi:uncharacterized membrane protein
MVNRKRHIAKTITYRIISTIIGFGIVYILSGSLKTGVAFSFLEIIYKPVQYYIHERVWYRYIKYGLK